MSDSHHFYATTAFGWGVGPTREAAIRRAIDYAGSSFDRRTGINVWSARVDLPLSAPYAIEYYTPKDVPLSEPEQVHYTVKGRQRELVKVAR